jgi:AraC-like DNA-binding protein
VWQLRTAELAFCLGGERIDEAPSGPLLVCPTGGHCEVVGAAAIDPVFVGLRASGQAPAAPASDAVRPLLLWPREPALVLALAGLAARVEAVYLPPPLHLGLHWLAREMALRGTLPQAHLLGLAARLAGWLRALPRMQRAARGGADDALGELGRRLQRELLRGFADKLTLDELGERLGSGRAQLTRAMRRLNGFSVARYRTELRLRHAAVRLLDGAAPCAAVAREVGYASPGRFSQDFGRLYGAPPSRLAAALEASIGLGGGS